MKDQPTARGGGVKLFVQGSESHLAAAQVGDDGDQVLQGATESGRVGDHEGVALDGWDRNTAPAAALREWHRVCRPQACAVVTVPAADGITFSRVLRQAAADEDLELIDPSGPLADPQQRKRLTEQGGWSVEQVIEMVFDQP